MKQTRREQLNDKLMSLHLEYAKAVLESRGEDLNDWGYDVTCFWIDLADMYLSLSDARWIMEYEIPKELVYERYDMASQWFYSDRVKEAIKKDKKFKQYNLICFFRYFNSITN